jgi:hypothetical protein
MKHTALALLLLASSLIYCSETEPNADFVELENHQKEVTRWRREVLGLTVRTSRDEALQKLNIEVPYFLQKSKEEIQTHNQIVNKNRKKS